MRRLAEILLPAVLALAGCEDGQRKLADTQTWMSQQRAEAKPRYQPLPMPAEQPASGPAFAALPDPFHPAVPPRRQGR